MYLCAQGVLGVLLTQAKVLLFYSYPARSLDLGVDYKQLKWSIRGSKDISVSFPLPVGFWAGFITERIPNLIIGSFRPWYVFDLKHIFSFLKLAVKLIYTLGFQSRINLFFCSFLELDRYLIRLFGFSLQGKVQLSLRF